MVQRKNKTSKIKKKRLHKPHTEAKKEEERYDFTSRLILNDTSIEMPSKKINAQFLSMGDDGEEIKGSQRIDCYDGNDENQLWRIMKSHGLAPETDNNQLIQIASSRGNLELVEELLKYPNVDPSVDGDSPLVFASMYGHYKVVEILLKDKRVNTMSQDNKAFNIAIKNGHIKVVKLLMDSEKTILKGDKCNVVSFSCAYGNLELVKMLMKDERIDVTFSGNTALFYATLYRHIDVVRELLKSPKIKFATKGYCLSIITAKERLQDNDLVKLFIQDFIMNRKEEYHRYKREEVPLSHMLPLDYNAYFGKKTVEGLTDEFKKSFSEGVSGVAKYFQESASLAMFGDAKSIYPPEEQKVDEKVKVKKSKKKRQKRNKSCGKFNPLDETSICEEYTSLVDAPEGKHTNKNLSTLIFEMD